MPNSWSVVYYFLLIDFGGRGSPSSCRDGVKTKSFLLKLCLCLCMFSVVLVFNIVVFLVSMFYCGCKEVDTVR